MLSVLTEDIQSYILGDASSHHDLPLLLTWLLFLDTVTLVRSAGRISPLYLQPSEFKERRTVSNSEHENDAEELM